MTENLELREWIAVNVMGWEKRSTPNGAEYFVREGVDVSHEELPHYELTWNDAALVVEAMRARSCWLSLIYKAGYLDDDLTNKMAWVAEFRGYGIPDQPWTGRASQHSAPLAICLAAKAAIEATK